MKGANVRRFRQDVNMARQVERRDDQTILFIASVHLLKIGVWVSKIGRSVDPDSRSIRQGSRDLYNFQ